MSVSYFIRLERGAEDRCSEVLGPFPEYLQLTYEALTTLDGKDIAAHHSDGFWYLTDAELGDTNEAWSDIVMWAQ